MCILWLLECFHEDYIPDRTPQTASCCVDRAMDRCVSLVYLSLNTVDYFSDFPHTDYCIHTHAENNSKLYSAHLSLSGHTPNMLDPPRSSPPFSSPHPPNPPPFRSSLLTLLLPHHRTEGDQDMKKLHSEISDLHVFLKTYERYDTHTYRQTDTNKYKQTDRQTDRQTTERVSQPLQPTPIQYYTILSYPILSCPSPTCPPPPLTLLSLLTSILL